MKIFSTLLLIFSLLLPLPASAARIKGMERRTLREIRSTRPPTDEESVGKKIQYIKSQLPAVQGDFTTTGGYVTYSKRFSFTYPGTWSLSTPSAVGRQARQIPTVKKNDGAHDWASASITFMHAPKEANAERLVALALPIFVSEPSLIPLGTPYPVTYGKVKGYAADYETEPTGERGRLVILLTQRYLQTAHTVFLRAATPEVFSDVIDEFEYIVGSVRVR